MPNNELLSIEDQRKLFEIRNHMVDIPANFSSSKVITKCICSDKEDMKHIFICSDKEDMKHIYICSDKEDMKHIYICKKLNSIKEEASFEMICSDNVKEQVAVYKRFKNNMQ